MKKLNFFKWLTNKTLEKTEVLETSYDMRFARNNDVDFIINEIDLGVSAGCYGHFLKRDELKSELITIIEKSSLDPMFNQFLFVYIDNKDIPIGYTHIVGTSDKFLNIKMFGVKESLRGQGIGTICLKMTLDANLHHNFRAECMAAAKEMPRILINQGFKCIKETSTGRKVFEKRKNQPAH